MKHSGEHGGTSTTGTALRPDVVSSLRPLTRDDVVFSRLIASHRNGYVRDEALKLLGTARDLPVTVVSEREPAAHLSAEYAAAGVQVLPAPDLRSGLESLAAEGVRSILVEGGGRLAARLIAEGLVDRFYWVQCPLFLGDSGVPAFSGLASELVEQVARWKVAGRQALGDDTLLVLDRE